MDRNGDPQYVPEPGTPGNGHMVEPPVPAHAPPQPVQVMGGNPAGEEQQEGGIQISAVLAAFRRRWFTAISLGLVLGAAAAATVWYVTPVTYTSYAELQFDLTPFYFGDRETGEANGDLRSFKGTMMRLATYPFVLVAALREPGVHQCPTIREQRDPEAWLEDAIEVSAVGEQFMRISLTGERPADLKTIVEAVTNAFVTQVVDQQLQDRRLKLTELKELLGREQTELDRQQSALRRLDKELAPNETQVDAMQQAKLDLRVELRKQLGAVRLQIIEQEIILQTIEGTQEEGVELAIPEAVVDSQLLEDPGFQKLYRSTRQKEVQLSTLRDRLKEGHALITKAEDDLAALEAQLEAYRETQLPQIRQQLQSRIADVPDSAGQIRQRIDLLRKMEDGYTEEINALKVEERHLAVSWVDRQILADTVDSLKEKVNRFSDTIYKREIELEKAGVPIVVRRPAEVPKKPDGGKREKMAGVAGFGVFGLLVAAIVWLEMAAKRINSVDELEAASNLQVMATIPLMPRWVSRGDDRTHHKAAYWHSVLTESIDAARTLLLRNSQLSGTRTVMIASATGGEGKSTLSCHLATSLARAGRSVLLVDCDIRRPSIHRVFDFENSPGICDVLRQEVPLEEAIKQGSPDGLSILPAGKVDQTVLRLLAQDELGNLFKELAAEYDFIIIDSAPVLPVTDSLLIAQHVDAVMFSVRRDVSRAAKVAAAVQRLSMLGVSILGAVAIGLEDGGSSNRYYGRYGYGYGYNYGYRGSYHRTPANIS
ncbi:Tyrosine-protein kinase YwqD [Maioricimonas rarisocia]|uniref:non-specific protein-tyrosine kinase n=1 Tax=Maioricimonas rarisocia TaxID=2528026 RepID=A0A517Z0U7_9PLAN|nr:polysaccharide biosynthesis tyrosine autokinase [Maioricimonas rarisocia]QDU36102.1 Tyrosine-protein kinase YwqD [Maioricimonas rarisocia]